MQIRICIPRTGRAYLALELTQFPVAIEDEVQRGLLPGRALLRDMGGGRGGR